MACEFVEEWIEGENLVKSHGKLAYKSNKVVDSSQANQLRGLFEAFRKPFPNKNETPVGRRVVMEATKP